MFAYILHAPNTPPTAQTQDFFSRFAETPGLLHAFELVGVDDPNDTRIVAIWESREAAEEYLARAPLRREVDATVPQVSRLMYNVVGHK